MGYRNFRIKMMEKVVLAYSGGLDTSVCIKWLQEKYKCEVIAFIADLGQGADLNVAKERAKKIGVSKVYIENLKDEFINDYIFPSLKANAVYEDKYFLATALSRPLIAKKLVEIAKKEKAEAVAHGSTGKGNDQVRFDVSIMALASELKIIAPLREWEMKSREEEIDYAKKHNIPIPVTKGKPYSIDKNLWGVSIECGPLEDPALEPPADVYQMTVDPAKAPNKPTYLEIYFEKGIPIKLNNKKYPAVELINKINKIASENGIGRADLVENRLVGIKSREIYEAPAATVLYLAHKDLEGLTLGRETLHYKELISLKYSELIYYGYWFSTLREALAAFVDLTQKNVTGLVRLKLYKGNCTVVGRSSKYSLYSEALATYGKEDIFEHKAGEGFCKIWGLPLKIETFRKKQ